MTGEFQDKNVLITGASKGLGYVCSQAFESQGARLIVAARSLDKLEELRNSFLDPSKHLAFAGDLVDPKNIEALVNKGLEHTGGFDIVLHVLGGGYGFREPLLTWDQLETLHRINVGVAGHQNVDVGELVVANKIVDQSTAHSWYPPQLVSSVVSSTLITVDEPEETYPERAAYDMEAAGFFPSATRCSSGELVQSIKVISDNPYQSIASLNARSIEQLITKNVSKIEQFINRLSELSTEIKVLPHHGSLPESWANRWSFSVTQGHRLRRLLQRWRALIGDAETLDSALSACKDGTAVLTALEGRLNAEKPTYGRSSLVGSRVSPMPKVHSQ